MTVNFPLSEQLTTYVPTSITILIIEICESNLHSWCLYNSYAKWRFSRVQLFAINNWMLGLLANLLINWLIGWLIDWCLVDRADTMLSVAPVFLLFVAPHSPQRKRLNLRMKSLSLDSPDANGDPQHRRRQQHPSHPGHHGPPTSHGGSHSQCKSLRQQVLGQSLRLLTVAFDRAFSLRRQHWVRQRSHRQRR